MWDLGILFPSVEERVWVPPNPATDSNENDVKSDEDDDAMDTSDDAKSKFKNRLSDNDIDKFLVVARSVGTFARALDCSSSVKQPRQIFQVFCLFFTSTNDSIKLRWILTTSGHKMLDNPSELLYHKNKNSIKGQASIISC